MKRTLLHLTRFRHWLAAQGGDATVGVALRSGACPIAKHIGARFDVLDVQHIDVGPYRIQARRFKADTSDWESVRQMTQPWARRFIGLVDAQERDAPISARVALAMLDTATRSQGESLA